MGGGTVVDMDADVDVGTDANTYAGMGADLTETMAIEPFFRLCPF